MKIGTILPLGEDPTTKQAPSYARIREMGLAAEELGFDSIWLYDHMLYRFPDIGVFGIWEAWSMMGAIAEATNRVQLGTIVMVTGFRNPGLLAKMAVAVDEVSGGRLILGIGCGGHLPDFEFFGMPSDHRVGRFEEACQIIVPLIREGKVDFRGRYYSAPECELRPRGPRPGKPEILIASRGPRMLELTARYADQWNTAWLGEVDDRYFTNKAAIDAACNSIGRDPATLETNVGVTVDLTGEVPAEDARPALRGTPEQIAEGLLGYAKQGVGHVILAYSPLTVGSIETLGRALAIYREMERVL